MLYVFDNTTDITQYVEEGTIAMTFNLSNRVDTAKFTTINSQKVNYGHSVFIYEGVRIVKAASSGTAVLFVDDIFPDSTKWYNGSLITVDVGGSPVTYTVLSTDPVAKTITLTANLTANVTTSTKCGRLIFGGVAISADESETSISGTHDSQLEYSVNCIDWTTLFNRKNAAQEYQNMYIREIIGRVVYTFCAFDTSKDIDLFEAAWTQSGTGLAMANSTDRLQGSYSQVTGTSGTGTALWTQTFTAKDLSSYTNLRWWWKVGLGFGSQVTAMAIRIGTNASNYFEYDLTNIGAAFEDCWNFESVILSMYSSKTGSPVLTSISWAQLVVTSGSITTGNIYFDHLFAASGSFTLQNVTRGTMKFTDVRAQYQSPSALVSSLAKSQAFFWYIDVAKDLHLFSSAASPASPYNLTDSSQNYSALVITPDIQNLRNRVTVRGGLAPSIILYTQTKIADGSQTSFTLDYPPSANITITVGGVSRTIGEEGYVSETAVQWVYNVVNKTVRKTSGELTPAANAAVVFTYFPQYPVRVRLQDATSIATMQSLTGGDGIYDGPVVNDQTIVSFADALTRATAELTQFSNAIVTAVWETEIDGLQVGQIITITDSTRGISAQPFLIQKISIKQNIRDRWRYTITASTTLFGLVEFIQMLLNRTNQIVASASELVDSIINVDDAIAFTDSLPLTPVSKSYNATKKLTTVIDCIALEGTSISATGVLDLGRTYYGLFTGGETGSIVGDSASHYAFGAAVKITTVTGGSGKEISLSNAIRALIPAAASTLYTIDAWIEIGTALTNVSSGGARILVKEYSAAGALLATNTIVSGLTGAQDFTNVETAFTTNASTTQLQVVLSVYQAAGAVSFANIRLTPATAETATNAAYAGFSQAS